MKMLGLALFAALLTVLGFAVAAPTSVAEAIRADSKQPPFSSLTWSPWASVATSSTFSVYPRFISYNIRMAVEDAQPPEPAWSTRLPSLVSQLQPELASHPDTLLCMQEALSSQVDDMLDALGGPWSKLGVGRDDGKSKGEFSPIFYNSNTWKLERYHTYWLSETPEELGSKGWDAAFPRIATTARFSHRQSGLPLVYMCTHFDHKGKQAQKESAKLIARIADEWSSGATKQQETQGTCDAASEPVPVFVAGDLNIEPGSGGYQQMVADGAFDDVRDLAEQTRGFKTTYTGFNDDKNESALLDYVFVWRSDVRDMELLSYNVLRNKDDDGVFTSDHRAVVVDAHFEVDKGCAPKS